MIRSGAVARRLATRWAARAAAQHTAIASRSVSASQPHTSTTLLTVNRWSTTIRSFSSSTDIDLEAGRAAYQKARDCIDKNDMDEGMKYLSIAAHNEIVDAQYMLGSLLANDDDDDEDDAAKLLFDVEAKRQLAADEDEPEDIKVIRKRARQSYKEYLLAKRASGEAMSAGSRLAATLVHRATKNDLDRAFGVALKQLLDPESKLRPLSALAQEEKEKAELTGDSTQAVEWIRRAAENGHRDAHVYLGNLCLSQEPPLVQNALEWYFRVTPPRVEKNPHPDALFNIGMLLFEGEENAVPPFPANRGAAIPYFVRAAEEGDTSAQFFMGQLLHGGDEELEIDPNATSALMLIERAADNEHSGAQFYLAQLYRSGDEDSGIKPDRTKFLKYLNLAIEGGDEEALYCMGDIYFHGSDGFERDLEQARKFYEVAGAEGSADAYCCLGALYYNGEGVKQDYEKAFVYYQAAADRHSMEAWKNLADMYYLGQGVPKNEATAESILRMLQKMEAEEESDDE